MKQPIIHYLIITYLYIKYLFHKNKYSTFVDYYIYDHTKEDEQAYLNYINK